MPEARTWTPAQDEHIIQGRQDGKTWAAIGVELGLSRNTIIERGRRLRANAGQVNRQPARPVNDVSEDPNRLPLPAGHRLTWGLISDDPWPGYNALRSM